MKDFTTFFSGRVSCRDQRKYSNCGLPEGSLCLKFKIFPGFTLLIITFSMWYNFNQLSPARSPCVAFLDPKCTTPCVLYIQPSYLLPGLWLLTQDQLSSTWHDQSFVCPERSWTLPFARAFLCSDGCSDQVVWTWSTCCALAWSLVGTLGISGCSCATEHIR